jgi:di/tripeptidase
LKYLFKDVVVIQTTYRADLDTMEYVAFSEHFDICPEECEAPEYFAEVYVAMNAKGETSHQVTWKRQQTTAEALKAEISALATKKSVPNPIQPVKVEPPVLVGDARKQALLEALKLKLG